jgi:hypothetical protein
MSDNIFRVRFRIGGGHVHCRLFSAKNRRDPAWAKCGDFTVCRGPEFRDLITAFKAEYVPEPDESGSVVDAQTES